MSAEGKVSLNASQYKKTLDDIKGKTSKTFDSVGKDIGKAGKAVGAFSSEVSGQFGALSKIIGALTNPITLVIAGFGALLSAGKELYDVLTVSAEEYLQKVEKTAKEQKKQYDEMKTAQEAEQGYMERLKELGKKENKTNEEKEEMIFLVNTLTSKYGELGIEIDGVTGKLQNLAQAEETLNVKQKEARAKQLEELIATERKRGEKYYGSHLDNWGMFGINKLDELLGNNRMKVQDYRNKDTAGRLAFAEKSFDAATTKKELDFWSAEIDRLQNIQKLEEELAHIRETGHESTKAQAAAMETASKQSAEALEKQIKAEKDLTAEIEKQTEAYQKELAAARDLEKQTRNKKEQYLVGQLVPLRDQALRMSGRVEQADMEAAVWSATQAKGEALTGDEYDRVIEIAQAKRELAALQNGIGDSLNYAPRVNSLVARGGSEAPVKMPHVEELQSKTLNNVERITKITDDILDKMDDWLTV